MCTRHVHLLGNLKHSSLQENNWELAFYPESFLLGGVLSGL